MTIDIKEKASMLAVKCAGELHSNIVDGRLYHFGEQIEQVEGILREAFMKDTQTIDVLENEIQLLKKALLFYNDHSNWLPWPASNDEANTAAPITRDNGKCARNALEQTEKLLSRATQ